LPPAAPVDAPVLPVLGLSMALAVPALAEPEFPVGHCPPHEPVLDVVPAVPVLLPLSPGGSGCGLNTQPAAAKTPTKRSLRIGRLVPVPA
jgi:hypothetical protein